MQKIVGQVVKLFKVYKNSYFVDPNLLLIIPAATDINKLQLFDADVTYPKNDSVTVGSVNFIYAHNPVEIAASFIDPKNETIVKIKIDLQSVFDTTMVGSKKINLIKIRTKFKLSFF